MNIPEAPRGPWYAWNILLPTKEYPAYAFPLGTDSDEAAQRVRLCAAAPDLLAALVRLINCHTGAEWQTPKIQRDAWTLAADAVSRAMPQA